jgi:nuclear pore complex protein Nup205
MLKRPAETHQRGQQFEAALKDGAFDFILSLSADVKPTEWYDPARYGLRQYLQRKAPFLASDSVPFSDFFQEVLMELLETFVESFITNLPDALRKLRQDEDEQRQLSQNHEHDPDLEKFVVVIAYAYDGRPKAAMEAFWDAPDGALLGFVHWTSKRASTPLVSAFCEMLQAISADDECATAAHHFLLDEGAQSSGKIRRSTSLTWNQIFKELTYYSSKIRDLPALVQGQTYRSGKPPSDPPETEPEASIMLESYLRLITRLCSESNEARAFLAQHQSFHLTDLLFQLASSSIPSRLRACAFATLRSLLTQKTKEAGEYLWTALDVWMTGGYSPGSTMPKSSSSSSMTTAAASIGAILKGLKSGFEEPNAFVQLLHALVQPYHDESGLNDDLPFPENLGVSTRQPGIEPYIDFVLGEIFGSRAGEINEPFQLILLQLSCLDFIATCLDTFNEDLVIFASQSNIVVDAAIRASNLQSYVLLHPVSRVMEWMFNDKAMAALFATIHQDPADVARASPDSPLIMLLLRGTQVVNSILELQPTYLDILRPLIKSIPNYRRTPVANAAYGCFEDGVLNHLTIFSDLGQYCGAGHPELVLSSLRLLEKLSASPKFSSYPSSGFGRRSDRNKALAALDDDAESISKILLREMESSVDINQGPESSTYIIKIQILDFLDACLRNASGQPTIAHLLLGFRCENDSLSTDADGSFGRGVSLFHSILNMVLGTPLSEDGLDVSSWLVTLSHKGLQVLRELWSSPISSVITMAEMQANDAFFLFFVKETIIQAEMSWDGWNAADPAFTETPSASCLSEFLGRRSLVLQYLAAELRQVARSHSPSLKQRMFETLLGSTTLDDGQKLEHATIFELFDFMENEFPIPPKPSQLVWFTDVDVHACLDRYDDLSSTYNLRKTEELLLLRRAELTHAKRLETEQAKLMVNTQAQALLQYLTRDNQVKVLNASRVKVLKSWVQLTLLMIENGDFDGTARTSFVLRCLQTIMPRTESDLEAVSEALELARLAKALIFSLDFGSDSFKQGDIGDLVSDRLFHLFQVSLRAIITLGAKVELKALYYDISYRYLAGMSDVSGISGIHRRHSIQTIKGAGERFVEVICDDAHAGEPTCRIAALLVLGALVRMGRQENSKYMIESLARLNFVGILVDSIQHMSSDLRETAAEGMPSISFYLILLRRTDVNIQLSYCHAKLALLLHISQTRLGAVAVLNAGLLHSIKVSGLFATDPDLGVGEPQFRQRPQSLTDNRLDIEGSDAVNKHYRLLAAIMRVVCASVLSRGSQNQQTLEQGRRFISENRLSILAVLKKSAGLGNISGISQQRIDDLADSFTLLMSVTGFLDVSMSLCLVEFLLRANIVLVRGRDAPKKASESIHCVHVSGVYF